MNAVQPTTRGKIPPGWTRDDVVDLVERMGRIFTEKHEVFAFLEILATTPDEIQGVLEPLIEINGAEWAVECAQEVQADLSEVLTLAARKPERLHEVLVQLRNQTQIEEQGNESSE